MRGWVRGALTEKTLSGWPLALMLVSWTCFSTIQASSCLPFCNTEPGLTLGPILPLSSPHPRHPFGGDPAGTPSPSAPSPAPVTSRKKRGLSGMVVSAPMAKTEGKAQTRTKTLQLWNWYAEPIWKLQPAGTGRDGGGMEVAPSPGEPRGERGGRRCPYRSGG